MKCFPSCLAQTWHQQLHQHGSKNFENRGWPQIVQILIKFLSWVLLWLLGCLRSVLGASWGRFGTVWSGSWVPTWVPTWSQLGQKIDPKIDHVLDSSWNRFVGGFLGAKMEASWYQNGIKNRFLRKHEKTHLELARYSQIGFRRSELGAKIAQKSIQK